MEQNSNNQSIMPALRRHATCKTVRSAHIDRGNYQIMMYNYNVMKPQDI